MKLETFFEKFDLLADAPNAVAKMRKLVMQLAVQGKLVERKESDGNAAEIFSDGLPPEAISRHEVAENWIWIRFAAVGKQRLGKMLDQKGNRGELKPYLRNTNVQWMRFQLDDIKELRLETDELEEFRLLPGDLLICEGGEPGRCAIWRDPDCEMYFQKAIHRVRPRQGILAEYLAICLQVDAHNGVLAKHFTGATIKHFTGRSLSEYSIPLPPLAEQKRIVAKVDELMALCDRLEAQQEERETRHTALAHASLARFADAPTPANLEYLFHSSFSIPPSSFRKTILTLAVQGKLVPQDPNDEPAETAVLRIQEQRERLIAAKHFRRSQLPAPLDENPVDIPESWAWTHLGNAMLNVTDGFHSTPRTIESGVRYVTAKHVKPGLIDFDSCLYVSQEDFEEIASKTRPRKGDVLVVNIGAGCGLASIIEADFEFAFKNVAILNRPDDVDPQFLFNFLMSKRDDIFDERTKGGAQPFLSLGLIRGIPFPLPPLAEQRRIVAKVEQLMALVDELETQLAASRATASALLDAIVHELTSGGANHAVDTRSTGTASPVCSPVR